MVAARCGRILRRIFFALRHVAGFALASFVDPLRFALRYLLRCRPSPRCGYSRLQQPARRESQNVSLFWLFLASPKPAATGTWWYQIGTALTPLLFNSLQPAGRNFKN